ncbi:MAG: ferrous iron transport protein A [Desulfobulbaceae bacterium]|jgi:Fe2+ transport system protein FeoA|nr:ferrous iron transport protein A [Desulfobulbaceae bacterium]
MDDTAIEHMENTRKSDPSFALAMAGEGEIVRIFNVRKNNNLHERLTSMGLYIQDKIKIVRRQDGGAVLVEKGGSRYVLGGGMAQKINVIRCGND